MSVQLPSTCLDWEPCRLCRRQHDTPRPLQIPLQCEPGEFAKKVAQYPANVASETAITRLFGPEYVPGTFILAERLTNPGFLDPGEPDFATFIKEMVLADLNLLASVDIIEEPSGQARSLASDLVLAALEAPVGNGRSLCETITNQEATDIVWRLLKVLIFGDFNEPLYTHQRQVTLGREVALRMIAIDSTSDLHALAVRSVMSGLIGTNVKETTKLVGPSQVLGKTPFPLELETDPGQQAETIIRSLSEHARSGLALDCWEWYRQEVLERPGPVKLVFCTDDYVETVFDLHFLQEQMRRKSDLQVTILPRNGRYGNDACHCDVSALIQHHLFATLHGMQDEGRLTVCKDGPVMGGINGWKLSPAAAALLARADVVVVKGARAFEMLQGLNKPTYFAFNIVRSYTESITGVDAEKAQGAFLRQAPGERRFSGFRVRGQRKIRSDKGREMMLAERTALENCPSVVQQPALCSRCAARRV